MGAYVFNNQIFDGWLDRKAEEILSKVNREAITTEEMIVLILKAQTNHFYHMDQETKQDMTNLRTEISQLKIEMREFKTEMCQEMNDFKTEIRQEMNDFKTEIRQDLKEESKKQDNRFMWSTGITVTMFLGLYLKLFLT